MIRDTGIYLCAGTLRPRAWAAVRHLLAHALQPPRLLVACLLAALSTHRTIRPTRGTMPHSRLLSIDTAELCFHRQASIVLGAGAIRSAAPAPPRLSLGYVQLERGARTPERYTLSGAAFLTPRCRSSCQRMGTISQTCGLLLGFRPPICRPHLETYGKSQSHNPDISGQLSREHLPRVVVEKGVELSLGAMVVPISSQGVFRVHPL